MQKKLLPLVLFISFALGMNAQITVTNSVFPNVGDVLYFKTVNGLGKVDITPAGANQTWDMADLLGTQVTFNVQAAAQPSFPTANMTLPEVGGIGGESFVKKETNRLSTVGVLGTIEGLVTNLPVRFSPVRIDLETPLTAAYTSTSNYGFIASVDPHTPAGTALDSIVTELENSVGGPQFVSVDSLRVLFTVTRTSEVDAWGSLTTPQGTFDVLRLKKVDYTNAALEVKLGFFGQPGQVWTDPSDPNGLNIDPSTLPYVGKDTIIVYEFWNNNVKQPILKANVDPDGTVSYGEFYATPTSTKGINPTNDKVKTYPNPAIDRFYVEMNDLPTGVYTFKLYDFVGKLVRSEDRRTTTNEVVAFDVNSLQKGTYLISIVDASGKVLTTRRVIIVRP